MDLFFSSMFSSSKGDHEHVICFYDHQTGEKFSLQGGVRIKLDESVLEGGQPDRTVAL